MCCKPLTAFGSIGILSASSAKFVAEICGSGKQHRPKMSVAAAAAQMLADAELVAAPPMQPP